MSAPCNCPKCGSNRISGPTYKRSPWGGEGLHYRCLNCGWATSTPTLDSRSQDYSSALKSREPHP